MFDYLVATHISVAVTHVTEKDINIFASTLLPISPQDISTDIKPFT